MSPSLFILMAEVLSRALNNLFACAGFQGFGLPKWSEQINYLSYANDTIIFTKADDTNLRLLMETLCEYESQSGQKINKEKSAFYVYHKAAHDDTQRVEEHTGFHRGEFPLTYLGCPVGYAKKRKTHFTELIKKVQSKLQAWK